jgi:hypothetical protein
MPTYLYTVVVNKYNSSEKHDIFHLVATGIVEATHTANLYVYEKDRYKNTPVEIVAIMRETIVREIVNSELIDDGIQEDPFDLESVTDESEVISFKHTCSNVIQVRDNGWFEIECPDCQEVIYREDIENVGGVWLYVGDNSKGKSR